MRPVLKPALRRVWRDAETLQIGVDPERAVVLTGVDPAGTALLDLLDGTRDVDGVLGAAAAAGLDPRESDRLLGLLRDGRVLDDAAADTAALAGLPPADRERLAPDLAALSLLHPAPGAALAALSRRRAATVLVRGAGRVGAVLAALLAAAGVGRVGVADDRPVRLADTAPGGLGVGDVGLPRESATRRALRRAGSATRTEPLPRGSAYDLVVLTAVGPLEPAVATELVASRQPHLFAAVRETTVVVGPLVRPGLSACLRCMDRLRSDRDPAWPRIAAQLSRPRGHAPEPEDVTLATLAAALAAAQALAHLDAAPDDPPPVTVGGTLELAAPGFRLRRRSWLPHPACGCHVEP